MPDAADEFAAEAEHEIPAEDELVEQPGADAPQEHRARGEPRHDGEHRRRRGRRGGRRNRQRNGERGPNEQREFAPADQVIAPPSSEPALREAVADLDAAPPAPRAPMRPETPPAMPAADPEPVRRRSTVRERAPVGGGEDAPAPAAAQTVPPEPVVETSEAADTDRPRKTGWWSRRFAGG
jgi:ribonuclease E